MNRLTSLVLLVLFTLLLQGCAQPPPPIPSWNYEKDAIHLGIRSDYQLNLNEGSAHTLMLCVYQTDSLTSFNQLSYNQDGVYKLLDCDLYDESVKKANRLIIHPGQNMSFIFDRAQGAKYVGVVAGYYLLQHDRIVRSFDIPVKRDKDKAWAEKMDIQLHLGPQQIEAGTTTPSGN